MKFLQDADSLTATVILMKQKQTEGLMFLIYGQSFNPNTSFNTFFVFWKRKKTLRRNKWSQSCFETLTGRNEMDQSESRKEEAGRWNSRWDVTGWNIKKTHKHTWALKCGSNVTNKETPDLFFSSLICVTFQDVNNLINLIFSQRWQNASRANKTLQNTSLI